MGMIDECPQTFGYIMYMPWLNNCLNLFLNVYFITIKHKAAYNLIKKNLEQGVFILSYIWHMIVCTDWIINLYTFAKHFLSQHTGCV